MLRNARARGSHGYEGPSGRRCSCCTSSTPNKSYRSAEKRTVRREIEEARR